MEDERIPNVVRDSFAFANLIGQDQWKTWTPVATGMTEVGVATYSGRFHLVGAQCFFQVKIVAATSTASTQGTTFLSLPLSAKGFGGDGYAYNSTSLTLLGGCAFDIANNRFTPPTWAATGNEIVITGWFEV